MKDEWSSVTTTSGALYVMTAGESVMPLLFAGNLVTLTQVCMKMHHTSITCGALTIFSIGTGAESFFLAFFGPGTGNIWLDQVTCAGTEARLADCPANPIGTHDCVHQEDASVRCQPIVTQGPGNPYSSALKLA